MEKFEIGEYVKTKKGKIGKVLSIDEDPEGIETTLDKGNVMHISEFKKHRKQLIDLIEVGDFVNGYKVISVDYDVMNDTTECIELDLNNNYQYNFISANQIKTIVTKEQFASIAYKVVEDK